MGRLRAGRRSRDEEEEEGGFETGFCGVWRFDGMGRAVEHWENAGDAAGLGEWLRLSAKEGGEQGVKGERE